MSETPSQSDQELADRVSLAWHGPRGNGKWQVLRALAAVRAEERDKCADVVIEEAERLSDCDVAYAAEKMLERIAALGNGEEK